MSLLVDIISDPTSIAHMPSKATGIWNLLFSDGHVDPSKSTRLVTWLNNSANAGVISSESANTWTLFRPEMDNLEPLSGN